MQPYGVTRSRRAPGEAAKSHRSPEIGSERFDRTLLRLPTRLRRSHYAQTSRIFLRRRDAWRSQKRWRRSGLPVSRQSSPSFKRFMTPWTRGRRERSTLAVAWAAYSTGGARDKGPRYCDRGCSSKDQDGGKRRLGNDYSNHHLPMGQLDPSFEKSRVPSLINFCQLVMNWRASSLRPTITLLSHS